MNIYAIAPLISFIFLVAGGLYVIKKGERRIFNWLFAFAIFVLALMEFGNFMLLISSNQMSALFWLRWVLAGLSFLPLSWTILSLIFARENYQVSLRRWGWYLTLLSIATLGFLIFLSKESLIRDAKIVSGIYCFTLGTAGRYFFVFLLLSLVVILLNFENTYRSSKDKQRQRIKYTIRGIGIFIGSYVALSSLALLFSYIDIRFTAFGSIAIITGFLLVARSILKYGFVDTRVYVGRQAIYTSATLSIVGIYLFMVGLITKIILSVGINLKTFFSFLAALFVFILFLTIIFSRQLKEKLRLFIDRSFYKGKYDYRREWGNLSERLGTILNVDELIGEVKGIVKQVLRLDSAEVVLKNPDTELMQWLLRYGEPISIEGLSQKQPRLFEENRQFLEKLGADILVSLNAKQKLLGILAVARKAGQEAFSNEDTELLKNISRQVSIAILNARLSEELIVSQEMEHFHKLSSFLIHDLKNFVSMLSLVVQNARDNFDKLEFRQDALNTISNTVARMNNLMQKLSTLPKELELKPQLTDLNGVVMEALEKSKIQDNRQIRLFKELNGLPKVMVDSEYIEKVILNLILNAVEAMPQGGEIKIGSQRNEKFVEVTVSDTGCGMPREFIDRQLFKPFQSTKNKGLGIGLFQCKTIVEAHGGEILVESEEGKGTSFKVRLPLR